VDVKQLFEGQAVTLEMPAPVRRAMAVRHFRLASLVGRDAVLRAGKPLGVVTAGSPVVLTVGLQAESVEGTVIASAPPDGLNVRLAETLDRRVYRRVPVSVGVDIEPIDGPGTVIPAVSGNLSEGGIVVHSAQPLELDRRAFVVIAGPWLTPVMAIGQVIESVIEAGDNFYQIRMQFTSLADEHRQQLRTWIARLAAAGPTATS
jgi:hypothetical protein